jgi:hypothetical protein
MPDLPGKALPAADRLPLQGRRIERNVKCRPAGMTFRNSVQEARATRKPTKLEVILRT